MSTMNHEQAIQDQAAERYLLGELDGPERDAYEEHFFTCAACAEEVKTGAQFARATRDFFANERVQTAPDPKPRAVWLGLRDLLRPMPAFAVAALVLVAGLGVYQNQVTIRQLRAPQVGTAVFLTPSRDAVKTVTAPRHGRVAFQVDVPPQGGFTSYEARVVDESGKVADSFRISAEQAKAAVQVSLDASGLSEGRYTVVVDGIAGTSSNKTEVARYRFDLKLQD
ncbi:MAG TPA: zf-HC2 domain-containing protein [Verrucomicrobiae bacterium]|jgi:anti-sigma factor RsiW|nr:zf-HC2 domain-containing protein [Verrucomicrobiae bacterium]